MGLVPGELLTEAGEHELNPGRRTVTLVVKNAADRPIAWFILSTKMKPLEVYGLGMNEDFWNTLPLDLKALVTQSVTGVEKELGQAWDALDVPGKKALIDGGAEAIRLSAEENAKFRRIGAEVAEAKVKELEGKGLPARAVYNTMKSLAETHAKTSKSFWD